MVSRATVSPSSSSSKLVVSNWNRTNEFHSHFVPLVLPLFSSKPTILPTSSISESIWSSRTPCSSLSLSLSLTSQHEIYSLKSLNYILVTNFFMPLRETKDSAEYYEAVLSLKSTGLTYLPHETISSSLLCVRERHCRKRTREKVALFALESSFIFFSIFSSSSVILSEPQREMIPLRVVVFRRCIHMCLHVFDFMFFF